MGNTAYILENTPTSCLFLEGGNKQLVGPHSGESSIDVVARQLDKRSIAEPRDTLGHAGNNFTTLQ